MPLLVRYTGLNIASVVSPTRARPYHYYKPIDFALQDINAPQQLGITSTEELVHYLSVDDDDEELGQDMEEESPASKVKDNSNANPTSALKNSSYAAPAFGRGVS